MSNKIVVALFGTCGKSKWRTPFEKKFNTKNVETYNPVVSDWDANIHPKLEAKMLQTADLILFPITTEEYGFGSLGETGFAVNQAITSLDSNRAVVLMVEDVKEDQMNVECWKASDSVRKLVKAHISRLNIQNLYVVSTLQQMEKVTSVLVTNMSNIKTIDRFSTINN